MNDIVERLKDAENATHALFNYIFQDARAEIERLRAKVDAMERQEPVAWAATDETKTVVEALGMNQSRRFDSPLFLAPGAQPAPSFADAYQGAMEEVAIWKKRALEAEDLNRKLVAEINGPTYMGEPPHSKPDCGEAGHDEGRCGNMQCLPGAKGE